MWKAVDQICSYKWKPFAGVGDRSGGREVLLVDLCGPLGLENTCQLSLEEMPGKDETKEALEGFHSVGDIFEDGQYLVNVGEGWKQPLANRHLS